MKRTGPPPLQHDNDPVPDPVMGSSDPPVEAGGEEVEVEELASSGRWVDNRQPATCYPQSIQKPQRPSKGRLRLLYFYEACRESHLYEGALPSTCAKLLGQRPPI